MTTIYYSAYEGDGAYRHKLVLNSSYDTYDLDDSDGHEELAAACAEDFHDNYDGWESQWPRVITLYASKDGPELVRMSVQREYTPTFEAMPVTAPNV
jgi:hypothetical protein